MSKSPELKATEKQIKEEQKHAREAARRERARIVVNNSKRIGDFLIMIPEAETVLKAAIDALPDNDKYQVSVSKEQFENNISDNYALVCEELMQYGMITAYLLYGQYAQLTLSESGKSYFNKKEKYESKSEVTTMERDQIFISHRTIDAPIADMIKDFLVNSGIPNEKIFCSSLPGNDVSQKISPEVKQRLQKSIINILILSKDYYQSAYCLNEAGIAWYLDEAVAIPIGLPEIDHTKMIGFLNSDYKLRRLDNDDDISYLYDISQEKLNAKVEKHSVITRETKKLKDKYKEYIAKRDIAHTDIAVEKKDNTQEITIQKDEGILLVYAAAKDGEILVTTSISRFGPSVEAGGYDFAEDDNPRECARWKDAVKKLEKYGLIECPNYEGKIYKVTSKGFNISDQIKEEWSIDVSKSPKEYL